MIQSLAITTQSLYGDFHSRRELSHAFEDGPLNNIVTDKNEKMRHFSVKLSSFNY